MKNCGCFFASSFHVQANNSGPGLFPSCHSALQQQPKGMAQIVQPHNQPFQQTPYQQSQPPRSSSILNAPRQIVAPERQLPHQTRPLAAQDTVRIFCCSFYLFSAAIRSEQFQLPFLLLASRAAQAQDRTQSPNRRRFLSRMTTFIISCNFAQKPAAIRRVHVRVRKTCTRRGIHYRQCALQSFYLFCRHV